MRGYHCTSPTSTCSRSSASSSAKTTISKTTLCGWPSSKGRCSRRIVWSFGWILCWWERTTSTNKEAARIRNSKLHFCTTASIPDPSRAQVIAQVVSNTFQLLSIFLHDPITIGAFIRAGGMGITCTALQIPNLLVARAGLNILLKISDSPALGTIPLDDRMLQFVSYYKLSSRLGTSTFQLIEFIEAHRQDDELLYYGTGFLSNFVAHKQHVKEIAIQNNAIERLHKIITEQPRLTEMMEPPKRKKKCDILCNCLRTMNNFLPLWAPTSNEHRDAGENERRQVCRFIEPDIVKKLMSCLSAEGIATQGLMELRGTIIRFFYLLCRTPFVPKDNLLNIFDEQRKENLVRHIVAAFLWARQQREEQGKQQLIERTMNLLKMLMEQSGSEKQVAEETYLIECPLNLINDDIKPQFLLTVLTVCDKILEHCPSRADIWMIDRAMLEGLTNHQRPEIGEFFFVQIFEAWMSS